MHVKILKHCALPIVALALWLASAEHGLAQMKNAGAACGQCGCDGGCDTCGCDGCSQCDYCNNGCGCGYGQHCGSCGYKPQLGCCICNGGGCCGCEYGYMKPIKRAQWYNWNRNYAYTDYGAPTALVVPPTANMQTNYGWGVASSRISRIDHQFQRNYPGVVTSGGRFGGPFRSTPLWPQDTIQFGVYPVRGPW